MTDFSEDLMPDDEASREALSELQRLDEASAPELIRAPRYEHQNPIPPRTYARPEQPPMPPPPPDVGQAFWSEGPQNNDRAAQIHAPPQKISSLEDLCSSFLSLGDGSGQMFLRVFRREPKAYRGVPCAGFVRDIHGPISTPEFSDMFGGSKYSVSVMKIGADGSVRTASTLDNIQVPGPVNNETINFGEDEMTSRTPGRIGGGPPAYGEDPGVAKQRLLIEEAREIRMADNMRPPTQMFDVISKQNERSLDAINAKSDAVVNILRAQVDRQIDSLREKDEELHSLRDKRSELQNQLADAKHNTETETIKRLNEAHEKDLKRIAEDHARSIQKTSDESRIALESESRRHDEERRRLQEVAADDRKRSVDDAARRETQLKDDYDRAARTSREQMMDRVADLEKRTKDQIEDLKAVHAREMSSIQREADGKVRIEEKLADHKVVSTKAEIEGLRSELERVKAENIDLRKKTNKDPVEYLTEVKNVATTLLGMRDGSSGDDEPADEKKEFDWKEQLANLAKGMVEKGPEMLREVQGIRQQQQQVAVQQQVAAQQAATQRRVVMQQRQAPGLPQDTSMHQMERQEQQNHQQPQRRRVPMAPPPTWFNAPGPPAPGASPSGSMMASNVPIVERASPPIAATSYVPQMASAPSAEHQAPQMMSPLQPISAPNPAQPTDLQVAPQPSIEDITAAQYNEFFGQLDSAIGNGFIPAKAFATGMVDKIGKDNVRVLIQRISADDVFKLVDASNGGSSNIMTRDGQKYVREVWSLAAGMSQ